MIIEDITLKISRFSNISDTVQSKEDLQILYKILSCLYLYSTDNKIFPNVYNDLKYLDEIKLMYDPYFSNETLFHLLEFFIKFDKSFDIKDSILNPSIIIHENIRDQFKIVNLEYIKDKIKKFFAKNPNYNYEDFFSFIFGSPSLKISFSDIVDTKKDEISPKILGNIGFFNEYFEDLCILEETRETGYIGEAFVYEEMKKSKKFKFVKWLALSDVKTSISIELNGKTYYINEQGGHYDIYAEDQKNKKYYVEVKSTNKSYGKLCFLVSQFQFNFAAGTNDNFYFAFVKNARCNPQIL